VKKTLILFLLFGIFSCNQNEEESLIDINHLYQKWSLTSQTKNGDSVEGLSLFLTQVNGSTGEIISTDTYIFENSNFEFNKQSLDSSFLSPSGIPWSKLEVSFDVDTTIDFRYEVVANQINVHGNLFENDICCFRDSNIPFSFSSIFPESFSIEKCAKNELILSHNENKYFFSN
jgi:hypothetical protein